MTLPQIDLWYGFAPGSADDSGEGRWSDPGLQDAVAASSQPELSPDDAALVAALQGSDAGAAYSAFDTIYRAHAVAIARFAYGYVRSRTSAEDVVADVFLAVWARREEWVPRHGIRAYLYAAARHRALNVLRGETRTLRRMEIVAAESSPAISGEAADEQTGLEARLAAALAALPEDARRLAELRWRNGLSPSEIATVLGIDRSAVDNRLSRLVKRLRALAAEAPPPVR